MEKLGCPGCGSSDLTIFNEELFRCSHCGSLILKPNEIIRAKPRQDEAVSPNIHREEDGWREKYERRLLQNSGLLTDFVVDGEGVLIKYEGTDANVVIPEGVKAVGKSVFHFNLKLETVTIPHGVITIDWSAFFCCRNLKSVVIPDSVKTINRGAFNSCALETVTIPDGVSFLANDVFEDCKNLKTLFLPDSIKSIGDCALRETMLTSINIPNVEHIGRYAFQECTGFKEFYIPPSVLYIDEYAFNRWEDEQVIYIHAERAAAWNKKWKAGCDAKIVILEPA